MTDDRFALEPGRLARAFELVRDHVEGGRAPYAALAVARGDGLVRSAAFLPGSSPEPPPRSPIASITKPITATAVMQLVEDGRLVLTEPVATYLPEFQPEPADAADPAEPITTWHVLTHTAGLGDASDAELLAEPPTAQTLFDLLCRRRLRFRPGSAYAYASDSFLILARLVETLSGMPYRDYLARRVLEPLGMRATTFDPAAPGPPFVPMTGQLGPVGIPHEEIVRSFIALEMPGGGLWSTTADLVRFGRAMLLGGSLDGERIIGRPFVDLMVRYHTGGLLELGSGREPLYGLGWGLPGRGRGSPASPSAFGHNGATGSTLIVDPGYDLVVVYLRSEWGATTTPTEEAVQAVYGALERA
jgi:CubicO group peptidase (beta-lactamase class C family)